MISNNSSVRIYGKSPFRIAVLHGGPGAPGYMAPVARELSKTCGILEPLQSEDSVEKQIAELNQQLTEYGNTPLILIGSSWGAVLALFMAARYPDLITKIILIGSAVFDSASSEKIHQIRMNRLSEDQKRQHYEIENKLTTKVTGQSQAELFKKWGALFSQTDSYDPIEHEDETLGVQPQIFNKVWPDFVEMRDHLGFLPAEFSKIKCPATIIHGDYDPHPIEGIQPFLENCIADIKTHILEKCGHYPWLEKQARNKFYNLLLSEINLWLMMCCIKNI